MKRAIALGLFLVPFPSVAAETLSAALAEPRTEGLHLFGSLGAGYSRLSGGESIGGPEYSLGALFSYETRRAAFDLGVNWLYSSMSGGDADRSVKIVTRAGNLEFSPKLKLSERWQVGPAAALAYGTDTSFATKVGGSSVNAFLGARASYEWAWNGFPMRVTPQLLTDWTISGRQVWLATVSLQFGFPLDRRRVETERKFDQEPIAGNEVPPVRVVLDPQKVFFRTDSAALKPEAARALNEVGRLLAEESYEWKDADIAGHADQRGRYEYNLKLSLRRADSVKEALARAGTDADRLKLGAFSFSQPVDPGNNPKAWAKNRRVEVVFHGVRDPKPLVEKLKPLMKITPSEDSAS